MGKDLVDTATVDVVGRLYDTWRLGITSIRLELSVLAKIPIRAIAQVVGMLAAGAGAGEDF